MKLIIAFVIAILVIAVQKKNDVRSLDCSPTLTTVSGRYAPPGPKCHDQAIFYETFDTFNMYL